MLHSKGSGGFCLTLCDPALLLRAASHRASASRLPGRGGGGSSIDFLMGWSSGLSLDLGPACSCAAHFLAQTSGLYTLFLLDPARRAWHLTQQNLSSTQSLLFFPSPLKDAPSSQSFAPFCPFPLNGAQRSPLPIPTEGCSLLSLIHSQKSSQCLLKLRILRDYSKSNPSRGTVPSAIPKSSLPQLPLTQLRWTQLLLHCPSHSSSCSLCSSDTQAPLPFSLCLDACPENTQGQVHPDCPV